MAARRAHAAATLALLVAALVLSAAPAPAEGAVANCGQVVSYLAPCISYAMGRASGIGGIKPNLVAGIPGKCGVNIPYAISQGTDCSKFFPHLYEHENKRDIHVRSSAARLASTRRAAGMTAPFGCCYAVFLIPACGVHRESGQ
uniref:Bifunctional inhibitor/plant lipid transfer protein/seed storage helical domain-containing protein n=1 Tax=Aegilops tauschii TaxID=37682 RepID=M8ATK4_AEGTA